MSDRKKREALTDEVFRRENPRRDWDQQPLSGKDPKDAALIKAWMESTWKTEAVRSGTNLNGVAREKGYVDKKDLVASKVKELLELRYDPTLAIVAAAEYDKSVLDQVSTARSGTSLIPKNLTDDEKARYLYLCHHEGEKGARRILDGSLTDAQARRLFEPNVPDENRRDALVKLHGSVSKAYIQWLWKYIDDHIQPSGFRS